MTNSSDETPEQGISDDQLPEDLQPSEENPLAEPLSDEDAPDDRADLEMDGGKGADQSEEEPED